MRRKEGKELGKERGGKRSLLHMGMDRTAMTAKTLPRIAKLAMTE